MATNVNITEPPEFLKSYYAALAERGMNLGNLGFQAYDQARVAPWNDYQNAAAQMVQTRALQGSPAMGQAGNAFSGLMRGDYNVGPVANSGQISPVQASTGPSSIASGGKATAGRNAYLGMDNPYLNKAIGQAMGDVESRINSRFSGNAFGGTAHQQTLARELGNVANNMRMQDYTQQQGLSESDVNRQLQTQQYNIGNQNQLNQFNANLGMQNANIRNQIGLANAGFQGQNIANQNATNQFNANLGVGNRAAVMQGLNFAPTLAANDYADAQAMMSVGNQLQGNNQKIADANYQEFLRQQQYPGQQMQWMAQGLAPSAGAFQNSTSTNNATTGGNTFANMAGGAALGYGAGSFFNVNPWMGALGGAALGGLL